MFVLDSPGLLPILAPGLRDQSAALASAEPEPEQQAAADEAGRLVPRSAAEG